MPDDLQAHPRFDIFCRVVDNYGDIGVCWRLARQLSVEFGVAVRLIVDDLTSFEKIEPAVVPGITVQTVGDVEVMHWREQLDIAAVDCVIEAFACELPYSYLESMARRDVKPLWINLEYLSAEPWVAEHHLLPSPHPRLALIKYFFFPGFTPGTGGLIRERMLAELVAAKPADEPWLRVFLFGYPNDRLVDLLDGMRSGDIPVICTIPEGAVSDVANEWHRSSGQGNLRLSTTAFVPQADFDSVLLDHDVCFVRGEDSFVRAQWAAKPFVWQIYPQAEGAHWPKLDAFLNLYCAEMTAKEAMAVRRVWRAWNGDKDISLNSAWAAFVDRLPSLTAHAAQWRARLAANPDLATNLVTFYQKSAKI